MNIIVTGASRGIGYELVKQYSSLEGSNIVAISRNKEKLEMLQEECSINNCTSKVHIVCCDLSDEQQVVAAVNQIKTLFNSVDILVNNAGAIVNKPFETITAADLNHAYQVNVFSVVRLIQELLPLLSSSEKAHVVNISSMGGFQGSIKFAGLSAYSSSKAALACLTECLAEEYKESKIAFNCLALGATQTEMLEEAFPGYKAPISAKEMANYIANFSTTAHLTMNGKVLPVSMSNP